MQSSIAIGGGTQKDTGRLVDKPGTYLNDLGKHCWMFNRVNHAQLSDHPIDQVFKLACDERRLSIHIRLNCVNRVACIIAVFFNFIRIAEAFEYHPNNAAYALRDEFSPSNLHDRPKQRPQIVRRAHVRRAAGVSPTCAQGVCVQPCGRRETFGYFRSTHGRPSVQSAGTRMECVDGRGVITYCWVTSHRFPLCRTSAALTNPVLSTV